MGDMDARIYQRPKNAMQSGRARTAEWVLEFEPQEAKRHDPLTGWTGSGDTRQQISLVFPSCAAAADYAKRAGLAATVVPSPAHRLKLQSYADNFMSKPKL